MVMGPFAGASGNDEDVPEAIAEPRRGFRGQIHNSGPSTRSAHYRRCAKRRNFRHRASTKRTFEPDSSLISRCLAAAGTAGGAGEIARVSHKFDLEARFWAVNSKYPFITENPASCQSKTSTQPALPPGCRTSRGARC
jgi:hypothetical protein